MAKLTAPILSFGGSGAIAKTLVFASWRGVKYARQYVVPSNPDTVLQQGVRGIFRTMQEMWKVNGAIGRAAWDRMAQGRKFLGVNKWIGENVRVMNGEVNMNNFIGSPGAAGGTPPLTVTAAAGAGSGEIDITFTNPSPPTGWTLTAEQGMAFPDQDPKLTFVGPLVEGENDPVTGTLNLTGLGSAVACQAIGWLKWTKPDGTIAYSVGITDQATSGV